MIDLSFSRPWTSSLLLLLGIVIIFRFLKQEQQLSSARPRTYWLAPLGIGGGFVDATAGGGWGIITTSTLMASNQLEPRMVVGTTSTARFFVAVAGSIGFVLGLGLAGIDWAAVLAMLLGGLVAAPIAAKLVKRAPRRVLGLATGIVVITLNSRQLALSAGADTQSVVIIMVIAAVLSGSVIAAVLLRRRRTKLSR